MKPLAIRRVVLTQFRNYREAEFDFGDRFNLVSGLNGIGKTNLLDALYYLAVGRSYFTPQDVRVVTQDESFFRIYGDVAKDHEVHGVVVKVKPGLLKEISIDGIVLNRVSELLGFIPVVFSAPRDIELIMGSGQYRRRYLDHLLCQVDSAYLQHLMHYNHLLALRNAALKQEFKDLQTLISTYDEKMVPHAQAIFTRRKILAQALEPLLVESYGLLSDHREDVTMEYKSQLDQYKYEVLVEKNWESDKATRRSNAGIHKDDFHFRIRSLSAREFGSQGQIKSLVFALHLSKYKLLSRETDFRPVLMLDDIFDKLDETRLQRLMEMLMTDDFGQVFISDTSGDRVKPFLDHGALHHIRITS